MAGDVDAHHFAGGAASEAFDHAIGLRRAGSCRATSDRDPCAGAIEIIGREAGSPVGQHVGDAEGESHSGGL